MWLHPGQISASDAQAVPIPAGVIVGYDGSIASLGDYPDWLLCDGTNNAPDLRDRFIIGADDTDYPAGTTGGSLVGAVTGTSSTDGGHTGGGGGGGRSSGAGNATNVGATAGAHTHSLSGDLAEGPPSRQLVFIKSVVSDTKLPPNAVVWHYDTALPIKFSEFADLEDRLISGVGDDSRNTIGADERSVAVHVASAGDHVHIDPSAKSSDQEGGSAQVFATEGAHVHDDFIDSLFVPRPPFRVLLALISSAEAEASPKMILAYDGLLADLDSKWVACDGSNSTPDLRGRMALGKTPSSSIGDADGQATTEPVSGTTALASVAVTHDHLPGAALTNDFSANHRNYAWTHSHASWSGAVDPMPPYHCLHYIMCKGI